MAAGDALGAGYEFRTPPRGDPHMIGGGLGNWDPGVIASLTPDQKALPDLGWFPFPAVTGGQGDPTAIMGGSDGYSLSKNAPKEAFGFLEPNG